MSPVEIPLSGGRITAGIVRLGDTVRRPITTDRAVQHRLLIHLERAGFDGTPRFLGIDAAGREMLSFLPDDVPSELGHFSDPQLAAAAGLLRRFHDATESFDLVRASGAEIMCHNDWAPTNAVFRDGLPYGLIDFDTLAPGLRLWDLGYSASVWLDLGNEGYTANEQLRRLSVFAAGYALPACTPALIAIHAVARQTALAVSAEAGGRTEIAKWAASVAAWVVTNLTDRLSPTGYRLT